MSYSHTEADPSDIRPADLDDRNLTFDPDFEMIEELAFNIGWSDPDPAEDDTTDFDLLTFEPEDR